MGFALLALLGLIGCEDPRQAELAAELKALEEKRVPLESIEQAKSALGEAEAEHAALADAKGRAEQAETALEGRIARLEQRLAADQAAIQTGAAARDALLAENAALRARSETLRRALVERQRAITDQRRDRQRVCERLIEVVSQLREHDPDWAKARRLAVLAELTRQAAADHPQDREIQAIATETASDAAGPGTSAASGLAAVRARAERLRARLVHAYAPDAPSGAGSCPSVDGPDAAGHGASPADAQADRSAPAR